MNIDRTDVYQTVFPVVAGEVKEGSAGRPQLLITQIFGTAFHIGGGFLFTAAHVYGDAQTRGVVGIGFYSDTEMEWFCNRVRDVELFTSLDFAIVSADVPQGIVPKWSFGEQVLLEDVVALGYPYGLNLDLRAIIARGFKGHIVSMRRFPETSIDTVVYELSFAAPRGLSGAPLMLPKGSSTVIGHVIGNKSTEMNILTSRTREVEKSGNVTERIEERFEMLQLGIAIQARTIADVHSSLLGKTLREHLHQYKLLA